MSTDPVFIPDDDPGWPLYEQVSDEYREWFLDRKLGPADPEVAAILREWEQGGDGLPWRDAAAGDNQEISEEKAS